jgi:hypothetical protein
MAIDMIENNELAALSSSRLGSKSFIDDNQYLNLSFRSKKYFAAQRAENARVIEEVRLRYLIDAIPPNDCQKLQEKLQIVENDIENEIKKGGKSNYVNPMRDIQSKLKNLIVKARCSVSEEEQRSASDLLNIQQVLTKASSDAPTVDVGKSNTKYIIYGAGGLILVVALVLLLKNK